MPACCGASGSRCRRRAAIIIGNYRAMRARIGFPPIRCARHDGSRSEMMRIEKAVILAGGLGSRLSEETDVRPKPMVEIGGQPILWHIMKIYSRHGLNDFVICLGYKGYVIKEFFYNYHLHMADVTFDLGRNETIVH